MKKINLIIGCGYLGRSLLKLLHSEKNYVVNRSEQNSAINVDDDNHQIILNINDKQSWRSLDALSEKHSIRIYFMVPPSQIDRLAFPGFIERLNRLDVQKAVLVSSTVVYGNKDRIVDADSDVSIDSERAERQSFIEQDWLASVKKGSIVRFAGIYGPDRVIGKHGILKGDIINGDPDGWLNLIHVDDGAQLLKRIGTMDKSEPIELACDGNPIKRFEYYSFLAEKLNQAPPIFSHGSSGRGIGRRCDNSVTISRSGWQPMHVDFREAISNLIKRYEN
ncbi:MAG: nucleoside-diphosphate-sugar epimerase [Gammaproteobacteria bacterium]|jgi:nucleoside-diphosphate-sugar epimerase